MSDENVNTDIEESAKKLNITKKWQNLLKKWKASLRVVNVTFFGWLTNKNLGHNIFELYNVLVQIQFYHK